MWGAVHDPFAQSVDGLRLIAFGLKIGDKFEFAHKTILKQKGKKKEWEVIAFQKL